MKNYVSVDIYNVDPTYQIITLDEVYVRYTIGSVDSLCYFSDTHWLGIL